MVREHNVARNRQQASLTCCIGGHLLGPNPRPHCQLRSSADPLSEDCHPTSDTVPGQGEVHRAAELKRNKFVDYICSIPTLPWPQHARTPSSRNGAGSADPLRNQRQRSNTPPFR